MNAVFFLECFNLFFMGLLTGALFVIHYGVRIPLASMDERPQIEMRQALIYRLRILVPALFIPSVISAAAVAILDAGPGFAFRLAGALSVLLCFLSAIVGTAPINKAILSWNADAPPSDWRARVNRWELLDTIRTWIGLASFALMLAAMWFRLGGMKAG